MKKSKILRDKSIKQISVENVGDIDSDNVNIIGTIEDVDGRFSNIILPIIIVVVSLSLILGAMFVCFNYRIVQGHVVGQTQIGPISFVDKNYSPLTSISNGAVIYYDGPNNDFINMRDNFSTGVVSQINDGKTYVTQNGRNILINNSQINYVLSLE